MYPFLDPAHSAGGPRPGPAEGLSSSLVTTMDSITEYLRAGGNVTRLFHIFDPFFGNIKSGIIIDFYFFTLIIFFAVNLFIFTTLRVIRWFLSYFQCFRGVYNNELLLLPLITGLVLLLIIVSLLGPAFIDPNTLYPLRFLTSETYNVMLYRQYQVNIGYWGTFHTEHRAKEFVSGINQIAGFAIFERVPVRACSEIFPRTYVYEVWKKHHFIPFSGRNLDFLIISRTYIVDLFFYPWGPQDIYPLNPLLLNIWVW
jgi:hypothetical protein